MKCSYRGHDINVTREMCLAGYKLLYYSIYRQGDGYCCVESFEDSDHTVRELVRHMKDRIDAELLEDDPWLEREGWPDE